MITTGQLINQPISWKEALLHFIFWLFIFTSIQAPWFENWLDRSIRLRNVAPLSVILSPILFYANAFWWIPRQLTSTQWYIYFIHIFIVVFLAEGIRSISFALLCPLDDDLWTSIIIEIKSKDNLLVGYPIALWQPILLSFAYRFTRDWVINHQLINALKIEKLSMELALLKSQVSPHFLFNHLNALDDLIDRDQNQAKVYLIRLASIYRYTLKNLDYDLVELTMEWNFIQDYIYLVKEKYGHTVEFDFNLGGLCLGEYKIPPSSLQILIENAIKHNRGSLQDPLIVSVSYHNQCIQVKNKIRPKFGGKISFGQGLKNLQKRYQLLLGKKITIVQDDHFTVFLPLIQSNRKDLNRIVA